MVSVYSNPFSGQDFSHFYDYRVTGDPMKTIGMNDSLIETTSCWNTGSGAEDPSKKIRKPYTITKSRESWSEPEHDKFLDALQLFDRDWKKIEAFVGSKTVIQIRSHAQKYFQKVLKNGNSEHVPPPRPKRKAAHPYPQKATKNVTSQSTSPLQSSSAPLEPGYAVIPHDSLPLHTNAIGSALMSPWTSTSCMPNVPKDDVGLSGGRSMMQNYSHGSNGSTPRVQTSNETSRQVEEKQCKGTRDMPDFAQVYSFIGSFFDTTESDHLQRLKGMDPVNVETVLMLMKNLSVNLASPEFEDHRRLLSSYDVGSENDLMGSTNTNV